MISVQIKALHSSAEDASEVEDEKFVQTHAAVENNVCQCVTLSRAGDDADDDDDDGDCDGSEAASLQ